MRSKAPLTLIEQAIMLTVFGLAAVLCLQAFVWADSASKDMADRDAALIRAQNAAEVLKSCGGDMARAQTAAAELLGGRVEQGMWYILYDKNWNPVDDWPDAAYSLHAQGVPTDVEGLWKAEIWVGTCGDREMTLCSIPIAWQGEVDAHG